jgi:hypothetical protein
MIVVDATTTINNNINKHKHITYNYILKWTHQGKLDFCSWNTALLMQSRDNSR